MSKLIPYPHPTGWTPTFVGAPLAEGEELRLILAVDPPVALLRALSEAQERLRGALGAAALTWVDPRDFILPLAEVPRARPEALEAVVSRMRVSAAEVPPFRVEVGELSGSDAGERRIWAGVEDLEGGLAQIAGGISAALERDGFELASPARGVVLAEGGAEPVEVGASLASFAGQKFGVFTGWDLVLYRRAPTAKGVIYTALAYAPLSGAK